MEQLLKQNHKKMVKKRTLNLKNQLIVVNYNRLKPENLQEYSIGICLLYDEIFGDLGLDVLDLKRVLVSEEKQVLGFVFEYFDLNKEPCKDILISKKITNSQLQAFKKTPENNIVVVASKKDGTVVSGVQSQILLKK